jgi:4-diphosphocytidyl-2-C-methyl-D-erythritol kinase
VTERRASATAKINLALVVGPRGVAGKHEVLTLLQRIDWADRVSVRPAAQPSVRGFEPDTLVRGALERLAAAAGIEPCLAATIEKRVPVAAGLGGGSSDAATALALGNELLGSPLSVASLARVAAALGADVPFFLRDGPQLARGDGTLLEPVELPQDYWIVLLLPRGAVKASTASVYATFDARGGEDGFAGRADALRAALAGVRSATDLADLPRNDLVSSVHARALRELGAFRADVSGAGPVVYGLFVEAGAAVAAARALRAHGRTRVCVPCWYP